MTSQVIEVPDIAVVKTVNGTKKVFSLRDQKVKKGALYDFGSGSGVKYQGDLYVLDSGIVPIVRMTTSKVDPSFTVTKTGDIEVDWGDGLREINVFSHTYSDGAESHEVVFYGKDTVLTELRCHSNQLSALDVSRNVLLTRLDCYSNQLGALDVSRNVELTELWCYSNLLVGIESALIALANSLPQRDLLNEGKLKISNSTSATWIQAICDEKNWVIA